MKKVLLIIVSLVFAATACKPKDEKKSAVKAEIGGFERDWAAMDEIINNYGIEINQKLTGDSISEECKTFKANFEKAQNDWSVASKAFEEWKAKFEKGEVEAEAATKTLKEYKAKHEKYLTMKMEWEGMIKYCIEETSPTNSETTDSTNTQNID